MTIRRGGSPRDGGGPPGDDARMPEDAGRTPEDVTPRPAADEPAIPDFLRGGGSVRQGGSLRGGESIPPAGAPDQASGAPIPATTSQHSPQPRAPQRPLESATRAVAPPPPPPAPGPRRSLPPVNLPRIALPAGVSPVVSLVGLAIVAALSYALLTGELPTAGGGGNPGAIKTPTPSNVVVVDPRVDVPGTLVYVKDGNLWLQSGASAQQLTSGGNDAMPSWSADGQWIYFIRTTAATGRWLNSGSVRSYDLEIPALVRIHPDGTGIQTLLSGRITSGSYTWQSFIRQPVPSPDGSRVAIVTDHPQPANSDVVLKILNLQTGALVNPRLADISPLGHQDPAWSPDGQSIAYVKDARTGTRGAPAIMRYDLASKQVRAVTGPGYLSPAWSPDGRYLAATKTGSFGTDVVILDARTGAELLRVTSDELSFDPVWSPAGDSIAFFRVDHGVVDLQLAKLTGTAPNWTLGDTVALTISAGLDAGSRPSWFIPANQLPTPGPSVASSAAPFPTLHAPSGVPSATLP